MELKENEMLLHLKKTGIPVVVELGEISENGEIELGIQVQPEHKHLIEQAIEETKEIIIQMFDQMAEDLKNA